MGGGLSSVFSIYVNAVCFPFWYDKMKKMGLWLLEPKGAYRHFYPLLGVVKQFEVVSLRHSIHLEVLESLLDCRFV
ncbi:hypothetical protein [Cohnella cellulosilytica]|uniref:Uncharacterized protein n=2 Tax=Cohnella cellulosilytica TaxID=986710 RepID=A0ABW2FCS4_9BACL